MWDFSFTFIYLKVDTIFFYRHSSPSLHPHRFQLEIKWEWSTSSEQTRCEEIRRKSSRSHTLSGHWGLALEHVYEGPAWSPVSQPCQSHSGSIVLWPFCDYVFPTQLLLWLLLIYTCKNVTPMKLNRIVTLNYIPPWWVMICLPCCWDRIYDKATSEGLILPHSSRTLFVMEVGECGCYIHSQEAGRQRYPYPAPSWFFSFLFSLGLKLVELYYCSCLRVGLSISIHSRNPLMDMLRGLFPWRS